MQVGWIDYSKDERNKIVAILNALGSHEALNELGIGSVRDAFSDMLFPGISVLQTRAKYFGLIPYMFNDACMKAQSGNVSNKIVITVIFFLAPQAAINNKSK